MLQRIAFSKQDLGNAGKLGCSVGNALNALAGDQDMDVCAEGDGSRQGLCRGIVQFTTGMFGHKKCCHVLSSCDGS